MMTSDGTSPARNAAIWYAADGFDPGRGVNGRRMAGESLLRGWFRHAQVSEFLGLTFGAGEAARFAALAADAGVRVPVRTANLDRAREMAPVGTLFYSGPVFTTEAWRREIWGQRAYSICGMTHTMSTRAVMEGMAVLRAAPQAEWDAVICTSRAVRAVLEGQLDLIDAHHARRFGGVRPPRMQLPVIPLGVDCADFTADAAAGAALRARLGIAPGDAVALIVARLTPHEKFDPLPVYIALQQAQAGAGRRLHLLLYGRYPEDYSRRVFEGAAPGLMPDVGFHHLPHDGAEARRAALSAADMFLFPIDNLQESFGIAPVEAMAAGLPVIASDWDGIRDTVTPEVGIRVPTLGARAEHAVMTGLRYYGGTDTYPQFLSQMSAITRLDVAALAQAVRAVMTNPDLGRRLGQAGQARARAVYDWAAVVPVMQDLFAELAEIRLRVAADSFPPVPAAALAVAPAPMAHFAAFPTALLPAGGAQRYVACNPARRLGLAQTWALRDYARTRRVFEAPDHVAAVLMVVAGSGAAGITVAEMAARLRYPVLRVERCLLWLLKYDFVREGPDDEDDPDHRGGKRHRPGDGAGLS